MQSGESQGTRDLETLELSGLKDGSFRKVGVPYFGVLRIRILLFRVQNQGPLVSETPKGLRVAVSGILIWIGLESLDWSLLDFCL